MSAAVTFISENHSDSQHTFIPPVPATIEDTGLPPSLIEQLIFKMLYFRGDLLGRDLSSAIGCKFSLIESLIETMKRQYLVEVKRSLGMGNSTAVFALTESGRNLTREYLEKNQYTGPAPVPLFQYAYYVKNQRRQDGWLTPEALAHAYRRMVVTPRILSQIGPAVSSGNSFLIYGQPGNGKTFLAEALGGLDDSCIYVPHAIECQGNIIQVFDPIYHHPVHESEEISTITSEPKHDGRWIKCRRPFIVTGGELTLEMLDLTFNTSSRVYDAPYQLKGEQRNLPDRRLWPPALYPGRSAKPLDCPYGAEAGLFDLPERRQDDGPVRGLSHFLHQSQAGQSGG